MAQTLEVAPDDLVAVREWEGDERFSPAERAVLAATDETLAAGTVSAETWSASVEQLGGDHHALLELVAAIGLWRMVSGLLRSLEVPLEDHLNPWPPDGRAPQTMR